MSLFTFLIRIEMNKDNEKLWEQRFRRLQVEQELTLQKKEQEIQSLKKKLRELLDESIVLSTRDTVAVTTTPTTTTESGIEDVPQQLMWNQIVRKHEDRKIQSYGIICGYYDEKTDDWRLLMIRTRDSPFARMIFSEPRMDSKTQLAYLRNMSNEELERIINCRNSHRFRNALELLRTDILGRDQQEIFTIPTAQILITMATQVYKERQKTNMKHDGHWEFPKGGQRSDETILYTAKREFWEETRISFQTHNLIVREDLGTLFVPFQLMRENVTQYFFAESLTDLDHHCNSIRELVRLHPTLSLEMQNIALLGKDEAKLYLQESNMAWWDAFIESYNRFKSLPSLKLRQKSKCHSSMATMNPLCMCAAKWLGSAKTILKKKI